MYRWNIPMETTWTDEMFRSFMWSNLRHSRRPRTIQIHLCSNYCKRNRRNTILMKFDTWHYFTPKHLLALATSLSHSQRACDGWCSHLYLIFVVVACFQFLLLLHVFILIISTARTHNSSKLKAKLADDAAAAGLSGAILVGWLTDWLYSYDERGASHCFFY